MTYQESYADGMQATREGSMALESVEMDSTYLDIAEQIAERFEPGTRAELARLIHRRATASGALFMALLVFWWQGVHSREDGLARGVLIDLAFGQIALMVTFSMVIATLLYSASKLLAKPWMGMTAGLVMAFAGYLALDPIARILLLDDQDVGALLSQGFRVILLAVGVHFTAQLAIDAFQLRWLKILSERFDLDVLDPGPVDPGPVGDGDEA